MVKYETLMLSVPEITKDETAQLERQFDGIVQKYKGVTISFDRWGKYRLAYPVQKNEYGVYFLARYEVPCDSKESTLKDLDSAFRIKLNSIVMRSVHTSLGNKSLEYKKPMPLDETPRDVDKFLKENKMEGLLSNGSKSTTDDKAAKTDTKPAAENAEAKEAAAAVEVEKTATTEDKVEAVAEVKVEESK